MHVNDLAKIYWLLKTIALFKKTLIGYFINSKRDILKRDYYT